MPTHMPSEPRRRVFRVLRWGSGLTLAMFALSALGQGQHRPQEPETDPHWKLTLGWYRTNERIDATDVNLRWNGPTQTAWVAYFSDSTGFAQPRAGYEVTRKFDSARATLSLQAASGGFAAFALSAEIGEPWYAIVGFGRTNLRPYFNLNFDPNDAITLGAGFHLGGGDRVSLYQIYDDRLGTGQRVTHLFGQHRVNDELRLTADLFHKRGLSDADTRVGGTGLTLTLDIERYFVRLASDPYANFSTRRMTRLSFGMRF